MPPLPVRENQKSLFERRLRLLNRLVLGGCAVFLPVYLGIKLTGGSAERLQELPELFTRLKTPIVWEVPRDGVRYANFFHGPPEQSHKFVLIQVRLEARLKIGFPVVPKCFRLVDDENRRYYPLSRSPFFIEHADQFYMERGDVFEGELLFEIPQERRATHLLFDRYQE